MKNNQTKLLAVGALAAILIVAAILFATSSRNQTDSDYSTIETYGDIIPSTLTLHDGYGYLRIVLSHERLEELSERTTGTEKVIYIEPDGRIVNQESQSTIRLSHTDIKELIKILDSRLDQWSIAPVKRIPIENIDVPEYPENSDEYIVYMLMTHSDTQRLIKGAESRGSSKVSFTLQLGIEDDSYANLSASLEGLKETEAELKKTGYSFIAFPIILSGK